MDDINLNLCPSVWTYQIVSAITIHCPLNLKQMLLLLHCRILVGQSETVLQEHMETWMFEYVQVRFLALALH